MSPLNVSANIILHCISDIPHPLNKVEARCDGIMASSPGQLLSLMELCGDEAVTHIMDLHRGYEGLCALLRTSPVNGGYILACLFVVSY